MSTIRIKHVPDFKGQDVVLLAMDRPGLADFRAAAVEAEQQGSAVLQRRHRSHRFAVENGAADIALTDRLVVWTLDRGVVNDIIAKLTGMQNNERPCHTYIDDIHSPTDTLALSLDQYIVPSWLTEGREPIFGDGPE